MSPSGDVNADKLIEVAETTRHYSSQIVTIAANQDFTFSIYAKLLAAVQCRLGLIKIRQEMITLALSLI